MIGQNAIGTRFDEAATEPAFSLGTRMNGHGGKEYVYLQANGAVTGDGYIVTYDQTFDSAMADTDTAATVTEGLNVAVAECAVADGEYFWGQIYGPAGVRSEQAALADSKLAPTADAGQVDDAGSVGSAYIEGITFSSATGGADAVNANAFLNYPKIQLVGTYA